MSIILGRGKKEKTPHSVSFLFSTLMFAEGNEARKAQCGIHRVTSSGCFDVSRDSHFCTSYQDALTSIVTTSHQTALTSVLMTNFLQVTRLL